MLIRFRVAVETHWKTRFVVVYRVFSKDHIRVCLCAKYTKQNNGGGGGGVVKNERIVGEIHAAS